MKLSSISPQRDQDEFGTVASTTNPVFLARLGFVGVDFGPLGKVAIGKQYAVHYDIASYTTDRFNVFGGQGTHAYVAGTDGGETGTGRADRIVNYRNTLLKVVDVGVQGQFRGAGDDTTTDGVGGSLQFKILPGVKAGGTYTRTNWSPAKQQIRGLGGNSDYMAVGDSHRLANAGIRTQSTLINTTATLRLFPLRMRRANYPSRI